MSSLTTTFFTWIPLLLCVSASIGQIRTNYHNKSASALSDGMLFLWYFTSLCNSLYVLVCNHPFAFQLMIPLHSGTIAILIGQRLWYASSFPTYLFTCYGLITLTTIATITGNIWYHWNIGGIYWGWLVLACSLFIPLPQITKVYKQKHTVGLNPYFLLFLLAASCLQVIASYHLPRPTFFNALRSASFLCIQCAQYFWYKYYSSQLSISSYSLFSKKLVSSS